MTAPAIIKAGAAAWALALAALLTGAPAQASEEMLDYLYEPQLAGAQQQLMARLLQEAHAGALPAATGLSQELLASAAQETADPATYGMLLSNHGILLGAGGQHRAALTQLEASQAQLVESSIGRFSPRLGKQLMARGLALLALADYHEAEDSFRWAQHIIHRNEGVYARSQLRVIDYLVRSMQERGRHRAADREQRYTLRIAEAAYGRDSPELLPTLNRLGRYFAIRGASHAKDLPAELRLRRDLLFKESLALYQRAIRIVEKEHGDMDMRLLAPLRGMAQTRLLEASARKEAEPLLARVQRIVAATDAADAADLARTWVDLGDYYTIVSSPVAAEHYLQAWRLLQGDPAGLAAAEDYFGSPRLLFPVMPRTRYLRRQPSAAEDGEPLFVKMEFSVGRDGKVEEIRMLDKNVPNEQARMMRERLRTARYRPRINQGELLPTAGLIFEQEYQVASEGEALDAAE